MEKGSENYQESQQCDKKDSNAKKKMCKNERIEYAIYVHKILALIGMKETKKTAVFFVGKSLSSGDKRWSLSLWSR